MSPPRGIVFTGGIYDDLGPVPASFYVTTMWHRLHWWNVRWFRSDSELMKSFLFDRSWYLEINEHASLLTLKVLFEIHQSVALSPWFSLWRKHGGHSSAFSCGILVVIFWRAEGVRVFHIRKPFVGVLCSYKNRSFKHFRDWYCSLSASEW